MKYSLLLISLLALHVGSAYAEAVPIVGLWKQIDEESEKPRSLIRIRAHDGRIQGVIEQIFPEPGEPDDPRCDQCSGWRKNKPLVGLQIISGMRGDHLQYDGGEILDPETGQIYRCKMELIADGHRLQVRGYVGLALFGRSQTWERIE